jgi:hypothetical protein
LLVLNEIHPVAARLALVGWSPLRRLPTAPHPPRPISDDACGENTRASKCVKARTPSSSSGRRRSTFVHHHHRCWSSSRQQRRRCRFSNSVSFDGRPTSGSGNWFHAVSHAGCLIERVISYRVLGVPDCLERERQRVVAPARPGIHHCDVTPGALWILIDNCTELWDNGFHDRGVGDSALLDACSRAAAIDAPGGTSSASNPPVRDRQPRPLRWRSAS